MGGNIDIGENTENALAAGNVTKVTKGSKVKITIDQRNANGTGPFTCDMDLTGNAIATGQTALQVTQGTSKSTTGQTTLTVTMPSDMACLGCKCMNESEFLRDSIIRALTPLAASQGNVCTVRCRNAQDFGGCVAVQQTDTTALPADNPPSNINASSTLAEVFTQVQQDQKDLPAAIAANIAATSVKDQGPTVAQAILDSEPAIVQAEQLELQTKVATASTAAATTATNTNTGTGKKNSGKTKGNGNAAKASNNNRRETLAERRTKRFVNAGIAFEEASGN